MRWHDSAHHWSGARFEPRRWQAEALDAVIEHASCVAPDPVVVRAVMGSGKSILIAELVAVAELEADEVIVISTPTRALVDQLAKTIGERIGLRCVGKYYTHEKVATRRVVVACNDSLPKLCAALEGLNRRCVMWIADECHRTETKPTQAAFDALDPELAIGFTATPYRSSHGGGLSLYHRQIYSYGVAEALKDGVVVPWKVVSWTGGTTSLDEGCIDMCRRGVQIGPGVVNALTIDDSEVFAELLEREGLRAGVVHSKQRLGQNERTLEGLRTGELDVIVHVSMLQEGVDLPWLRWLCLRRPCGSKVRFAQEVGRVLRCHEGKKEAIIYDPRDLFGSMKLDYEAVLGCDFKEDTEPRTPAKLADVWAVQLELWLRSGCAGKKVRPLSDVESYLRQVTLALEMRGLIERKVASRRWRDDYPSKKQVMLVRRLLGEPRRNFVSKLPLRHRRALRVVSMCAINGELKKGFESDFITVLLSLRKAKGWPQLEEMAA